MPRYVHVQLRPSGVDARSFRKPLRRNASIAPRLQLEGTSFPAASEPAFATLEATLETNTSAEREQNVPTAYQRQRLRTDDVSYGPCRFHTKFQSCLQLLCEGRGLCLELGARRSAYKAGVQERGYRYVPIDIAPYPGLTAVGDAHRLPFADNVFDVVLLPCVLEHFRDPRIAMQEVFRVLKPGGVLCGSVAFLEPFHNSYFHFSEWALVDVLSEAGFSEQYIDTGVTGLVLIWNRIASTFGLGRNRGRVIASVTFPIELVLLVGRGMLLLKNAILRRDIAAFNSRFDSHARTLALRLAGHLLFRASKRDASDTAAENTRKDDRLG